jgi:peptidoglycan L-alanyl-D-glutamate endopeptidase CwlK
MAIILGQRSLSRLEGVHPDLVRVVKKAAAISSLDFTVLEGVRTLDRQRQLMAAGATKTMNSRHLTGHAVDIAPMIGGTVRWDWPLYHQLADTIKRAAKAENVPIQWGGDWRTFKDGPHWELPWRSYPKEK